MVNHPWFHRLYARLYPSAAPEPEIEPAPPVPSADAWGYPAPVRYGNHDGEKFAGGFGFTELLQTDYWTLRARSTQLFKQNLYARGIVRRLVTNIINTGLALEATPDEQILGVPEGQLADWAEAVENRFHLWERSPSLCDHRGQQAFGALQASAKLTALISGDVLVVVLQDPATGLPRVRLVDGSRVQSPFGLGPDDPKIAQGHTVKHGVELDADGRHVAFWVITVDDGTAKKRVERLAAKGKSGRRIAWLVYGTDKLLDEVRGEPLLSIILQSLREIDRYRDAVQRKAMLNATLAMFIKKDQETVGTRPLTGGAVLRGKEIAPGAGAGKPPRTFKFAEMIPGTTLDELAPGESPQGFPSTGTDEKFSDFEAAIVYAIGWALEIPPEILTLSFSSNYSASQAAINEFKLYLNPVRATWGDDFCQPIYVDWLLSETLIGRIKAPGLLEAWRDPSQYDRLAAWTMADWSGAIKPSVDLIKQANGYALLVAQGFISRDRATRETTGMKFSKNVAKLKRENAQLAEALEPLAPPEPEPAEPPSSERKPRKPAKPGKTAAALTLVEPSE
jgi:lambda family phage portal protein